MANQFKRGQRVRTTNEFGTSETGRIGVWNMGTNSDPSVRANWVPVRFDRDGARLLVARNRLEAI